MMATQRNLIVLARSQAWCAQIRKNFPNSQLSWALDSADLETSAFKYPGSAAIVEIPTDSADVFCESLAHLGNNSVQLRMFAIGGVGLLEWQPLLRTSGFSAWFWSLLQTPNLVRAVAKHRSTVRLPVQSIETRVRSSLPWPNATTDHQA